MGTGHFFSNSSELFVVKLAQAATARIVLRVRAVRVAAATVAMM